MLIVGIYPGGTRQGGITILKDDEIIYCEPIPFIFDTVWNRTVFDANALNLLFDSLQESGDYKVFLEDTIPKHFESLSDALNSGESKGMLQGILATRGIPYYFVEPRRWHYTILKVKKPFRTVPTMIVRMRQYATDIPRDHLNIISHNRERNYIGLLKSYGVAQYGKQFDNHRH